ncbi:glutathione S-transferase family protein [Hydrogenophaga sp. A37]|uniref:glutathione S-transferase family protein n=1 Tax=Hydrogenophaga sp. A37 TaxID=1945864 RepID=UPI000987416C|nr:glutathione S-transferase family protein [Hydrogenophaga sp. A37]OOG88896.1 glutathione S-transferase [Hydrogenophaga sp. A37]
MSLKLYFAPGACSFVPHSMLAFSGAAFEPVSVKLHKGEQRSAEYLALNPRGQVPVLVDDGLVITQIVAILLHLDAKLPEAGILPVSGVARTRALSTLAWMNNTVHPTFTHVFMPEKFTDDEAAQQAIKRFAVESYRGLLSEIEALAANAAPWLTGDRPGALDAYALTLLRWGGIAGIDPTGFTATWALVQRFAALPAVATVIERERLQLNLYRK